MPLVTDWDDPSNAVIKIAMIGDWTWKALYEVSLQIHAMLRNVTQPAKIIVDARYAVCDLKEFTLQMQRLDCNFSTEQITVIVLVSDKDSTIRRAVELLAERGNHIAAHTEYAETVNAARAMVAERPASGCA